MALPSGWHQVSFGLEHGQEYRYEAEEDIAA